MQDIELYNAAFMEIFAVSEAELVNLRHNVTPEWDSLTHMELISTLESKLNIMMEVDDIIELDSYERGLEILRNYGKAL